MNPDAYTDDVTFFDSEGRWAYFNQHTGEISHYGTHDEAVLAKQEADRLQDAKHHNERLRQYEAGVAITCVDCGRTYRNDLTQRTSRWRGSAFCSQYCESGHKDRLRSVTVGMDFKPAKEDPFDWLTMKAERLYTRVLGEHRSATYHDYAFEGVYWRGHTWDQVSPFEFASAFFDQSMQNMYADADERQKFLERLCESSNYVRYGVSHP